ncbi:MAG: replicative DNA helicase [Bacillota bacterium]|nr:replicative DNA helicase [Bacillota bacterium]
MEGRQAPYNLSAEQAVLGCMLTNSKALSEVFTSIRAEDFYTEAHRIIFDAAKVLFDTGKPVDFVTVTESLGPKINIVGGVGYISNLAMSVVTTQNISQYIKIVKDNSSVRNLIEAASEIEEMGYANEEDTEILLDRAEQKIFSVAEHRGSMGFSHVRDVVVDAIGAIEKLREAGGKITGLPTGFTELDSILAGLQKSDLILVAARPAMGKTAFALNIAQNAAIKTGSPVAIFNLEMSKEQIVNRMICSEALVQNNKFRIGDLDAQDCSRLAQAIGTLSSAPIYIDDTPAIGISEIRAKCRRLAQAEKGLGLIVIDHIQLMQSSRKSENRQQEISEISRSLKILAKEMHLPVIALSQLSRAVESRTDKRPMLSDLRESGAIEQDADVVMFLYRDAYYNPESEKHNIAECIIAKHRNGETGKVELVYRGEYVRFENAYKG